MTYSHQGWSTPAKKVLGTIACAAIIGLASQAVLAQAGDKIRSQYPQLADLFNAFDVTHAQTFEAIVSINSQPAYESTRIELREYMDAMARMTMSEILAELGLANGEMLMPATSSPYPDMEVAARINLSALMRTKHSDEEAANAFADNAAINSHASEVLRRGRSFENKLFEIFMDEEIEDKHAAINAAIIDYQSDERHSVTRFTNNSEFLVEHEQATGFNTAFPLLSGLLWTQQWLQLASLEALILQSTDKQYANAMETALERFWNKIGTEGGMSMFPAPSELPMAPAIAPDLYTLSPDAAIILDNLNILETVLADILSYPNVEERESKMNAAIALFTNKEVGGSHSSEYLLFALRGGIYNQGGPAVGQLMRSERNRSRAVMSMIRAVNRGTGR